MTLLDFPGSVACTIFLSGCNFRCPFCHNFELVEGPIGTPIEEKEFFDFLNKRKNLLDGIAITGGEPTLKPDLYDFMDKIKKQGFKVKLDTNGYNPTAIRKIINEKLADYIAMDVKNSPNKYALTTGLKNIDLNKIDESISILKTSDTPYEFRTTVIEELHDEKSISELSQWIAGCQQYFLQPFEKKETVPNQNLHAPTKEEMITLKNIASLYIPKVEIRAMN